MRAPSHAHKRWRWHRRGARACVLWRVCPVRGLFSSITTCVNDWLCDVAGVSTSSKKEGASRHAIEQPESDKSQVFWRSRSRSVSSDLALVFLAAIIYRKSVSGTVSV